MNKDRYSIIFNSKTGNTRKLADAIHEALPQENCDLFGAVEGDVPASEILDSGQIREVRTKLQQNCWRS